MNYIYYSLYIIVASSKYKHSKAQYHNRNYHIRKKHQRLCRFDNTNLRQYSVYDQNASIMYTPNTNIPRLAETFISFAAAPITANDKIANNTNHNIHTGIPACFSIIVILYLASKICPVHSQAETYHLQVPHLTSYAYW